MREIDFADGYESSSAPSTGILSLVTGTSVAPISILAATGITAAVGYSETQYVKGIGGVIVTANPQISAGTYDGQTLELIGTSDVDTVTLSNGTGLQLNGLCILTNAAVLNLKWNSAASLWIERFRNGMV